MNNHKVLDIYKALGIKERSRFSKFVTSPYYNESDILVQMNTFLAEQINKNINYEIDLKKLYAFIYNKKKFNLGLIRYFLTRLFQLQEKFIAVEFGLNSNDSITLCRFYKERNMLKLYQDKINDLEKSLNNIPIVDFNLLAYTTNAQELIGELYASNINTYLKYINEKDELIEQEINQFYVLNKLKQICAAENLKMISGIEKNIFFKDQVLKHIETNLVFKKNNLIKIYSQIYKSFVDKNTTIKELYGLIDKHKSKIPIVELKAILAYAQNHCLRQINKGKIELQSTLLDIYKISIESGIIRENNLISESTYNNVIFLGLRLKQYDWTYSFLKNNIQFVHKDQRDNAYNFNIARYYFFQKQYDKALISLRQVELNNMFYGLDVRSLLLKIYYETSEREAFYNLLISFRVFIKRKKLVSTTRQKSYANMMKYAKKIMLVSFKQKYKMDELKNEIHALNPCADKGWLIDKIDEKISIKA